MKIGFCLEKKRLILQKKILSFSKTARGSKFIVECDSISKTSQNAQKLVLTNKTNVFFAKKLWFFWKIDKGSEFAVEWDGISKISRNIRKLAGVWKKKRLSLGKNLEFFKDP